MDRNNSVDIRPSPKLNEEPGSKPSAHPYQNIKGLPQMNQTLFKRIETSINFYNNPFENISKTNRQENKASKSNGDTNADATTNKQTDDYREGDISPIATLKESLGGTTPYMNIQNTTIQR